MLLVDLNSRGMYSELASSKVHRRQEHNGMSSEYIEEQNETNASAYIVVLEFVSKKRARRYRQAKRIERRFSLFFQSGGVRMHNINGMHLTVWPVFFTG